MADLPTLVPALLLALLVGGSLGLLGGGGSILTVPILLYVARLEPHAAIATSLVIVGSTSVAALVPHAREGRVRWRTGILFGATSMLSAFAAAKIGRGVPGTVLLLAFGTMMSITGVAMMRGRRATSAGSARWTRSIAQGLGVGAITGFVGAGGGFVVVPALALLGGLSMREAVGTSLLVIAMNSAAALGGQLGQVEIPWALAAALSGAAIAGSFAGAGMAGRISQDLLKRSFAWFVIAMAAFLLLQEAPRAAGLNVAFVTDWPWILGGALAPIVAGAVDLRRFSRELNRIETRSETTKRAA